MWPNVSKVTSKEGHSVVLWRLWLLVWSDRPSKGPKNPDFGPKIRFFSDGTPFFVKGAFVTLGVGSVLAPSDLLCDFLFPSYAPFRQGNPAKTAPKSLPPPHCTVGAPSASNSPSALSVRAGLSDYRQFLLPTFTPDQSFFSHRIV